MDGFILSKLTLAMEQKLRTREFIDKRYAYAFNIGVDYAIKGNERKTPFENPPIDPDGFRDGYDSVRRS